MKLKILMSALVLIVVMSSCKDEVDVAVKQDMSVESYHEQEALVRQLLLEGCAPLVNQKYELRISQEEAAKRGVLPETYRLMQKMEKDANELIRSMIEKVQNDPNIIDKTINIVDYNVIEDVDADSQNDIGQSTRALMPSGSISTIGQERGFDGCMAPIPMKYVDCHCYASLFAVHAVIVTTQGASADGSRWLSGPLKIKLHASNTYCSISYATTDSNGGNCSWKGTAR